MSSQWQVGVLGLGHVGLPTALGLAELGWPVFGTDSDRAKVALVREGKAPFYEPELEPLLRKHLGSGRFTAIAEVGDVVQRSDILFICVGTPHQADGSADMSQVENAVQTIAYSLNGYKLIVEKSTSPVHTAHWIERTIRRFSNDRHEFDIACNPEFLREGTAVRDFLSPDRIVIGSDSERAKAWLQELYAGVGSPIFVTDLNTAETIKHAANSFLAMKVSFVNMVADFCEATGADVKDVAAGLGLDPRIGPHFLEAGLGYGGFCLPKDLKAFIHAAAEHGLNFSLLKEVERINESRVERFVRKLQDSLWVLKDKRLAIWGLAFKPGTDDVRESPSFRVVRRLLEEGAGLRLYDPRAMDNFRTAFSQPAERLVYCPSAQEAARDAHAILVVTEWPEFQQADWKSLRRVVAVPVVVDGRNCLDPGVLTAAGFEYYGMGRQPGPRMSVKTHP
jgi:UDPglucose 6-dehydrogenase